jgi:hypothetical protein
MERTQAMGIDMMECLRGGVSDLRIPGHPELGVRTPGIKGATDRPVAPD